MKKYCLYIAGVKETIGGLSKIINRVEEEKDFVTELCQRLYNISTEHGYLVLTYEPHDFFLPLYYTEITGNKAFGEASSDKHNISK